MKTNPNHYRTRWKTVPFILTKGLIDGILPNSILFYFKTYFVLMALILTISVSTHAQIISDAPPFVLTIDQLKNWTSDGATADPDNVSTVPLASKFGTGENQLDPNLGSDMQIVFAPDGMNGLANYTQEQSDFNLYNFLHWSYIDKVIWFGGTATQTVQIPSAPWVNTAHKNGATVFGNVFFAPNVFGGSTATVSDFLEKDATGSFIAAQKLKDMSTYYKFDGWFINMETNTDATNAVLMREFVIELRSILPKGQKVIWYDAMLLSGDVQWQNQLNDVNSVFFQEDNMRVSDAMFVNFFWSGSSGPNNSRSKARTLGRSEFDVFTGVDLWPGRNQSNFETGGNEWMEALHEEGNPITSLGLFVPNVVFQNDVYSNFRNVDNDIERDRFYSSERYLFAGGDLNPITTETTGFKGLGHWVPATSVINSLPFITSFNTGHGRVFAENGTTTNKPWHDISQQDILPTWQFALEGSSNLNVSYDFEKVYNGGTSLVVEGELTAMDTSTLRLYKTKLQVTGQTKIDLTYALGTIGETHMEVAVAFAGAPDELVTKSIGNSTSSGWNLKTIDLSSFKGKELAMIGIQFKASTAVENYKINIGELRVFDGTGGGDNLPIASFGVNSTTIKLGEEASFNSTSSTGATEWSWSFPGGEPSTSTEENPKVTYTTIGTYDVSLTVFNKNGSSTETKANFIVVDNDPVAGFTTDDTEIQVGQTVRYTNTSTNALSWSWTFPGATPNTSTEENPTVVYPTVGTYDVSLMATNADGSDSITKMRLISVTDSLAIDHTDPVGTGIITARAEISDNESKEKAFDNLSTETNGSKWLDNAGVPSKENPSWIQVQLSTEEVVNTLIIVSANDAPDRDPESFELFGSNNGVDFESLESWTEQFFTGRFQRKVLPFFNSTAYTYYRLEIIKNKGDVTLIQIGEIELRGPENPIRGIKPPSLKTVPFKLYPNPSEAKITLEGRFPENSHLRIINTIGAKVLRTTPISKGTTTIGISDLPKGIYILQIINQQGLLGIDKIIVE